MWEINLPFKHCFISLFLNQSFKAFVLEMLPFILITQFLVILMKLCSSVPLSPMPRAITYVDTNRKIIHQ